MMKIYKVYQMDCFSLNIADFKPVHARLDIEYVQITKENYKLVEKINKFDISNNNFTQDEKQNLKKLSEEIKIIQNNTFMSRWAYRPVHGV